MVDFHVDRLYRSSYSAPPHLTPFLPMRVWKTFPSTDFRKPLFCSLSVSIARLCPTQCNTLLFVSITIFFMVCNFFNFIENYFTWTILQFISMSICPSCVILLPRYTKLFTVSKTTKFFRAPILIHHCFFPSYTGLFCRPVWEVISFLIDLDHFDSWFQLLYLIFKTIAGRVYLTLSLTNSRLIGVFFLSIRT